MPYKTEFISDNQLIIGTPNDLGDYFSRLTFSKWLIIHTDCLCYYNVCTAEVAEPCIKSAKHPLHSTSSLESFQTTGLEHSISLLLEAYSTTFPDVSVSNALNLHNASMHGDARLRNTVKRRVGVQIGTFDDQS
jgi:hypothetical protein